MPSRTRPVLDLVFIGACLIVSAAFGTTRASRTGKLTPTKNDLQLQNSLSQYLSTPDGFRKFVTGKNGSNPKKQKVASATNCDGGDVDHAVVTVTALDSSWMVGHRGEYDRSKYGFVLAKLYVTGCDYAQIGLVKGHTAFLVVNLDPNSANFSAHFIDTTAAKDTDLTAGHEWVFDECPQQHDIKKDMGDVLDRDFVCQAHALALNPSKIQQLEPLRSLDTVYSGGKIEAILLKELRGGPAKRFGGKDDDPLVWIVCADGCCYVDQVN